ncbi:MAG TPA: peptide MFS transporter [Phycisphaerales bacterium]|nr:peptide MFS transporter [Phycisphaerales bacterium]
MNTTTHPPNFSLGDKEPTRWGHPRGLLALSLIEMWERFGYYGARAMLVLYLTAPATSDSPGRGWSYPEAVMFYGWLLGLTYLVPIYGGYIADRWIGTHLSIVIGSLLSVAGYAALAIGSVGEWGASALGLSIQVGGLTLVVIGTGHFRSSISVMVGQLYPPGDTRRDGGFGLFYMGINLGAFAGVAVCGWLGERLGWRYGFGAAAFAMCVGLLLYLTARRRVLRGIGLVHGRGAAIALLCLLIGIALAIAAALGFKTGAPTILLKPMTAGAASSAGIAALALIIIFVATLRKGERGRVASIFILMVFQVLFWMAFEQSGSSLNVFIEKHTDRALGGFIVPTTWFLALNALLVILLSPVFAQLWMTFDRRSVRATLPLKAAAGLFFLGSGFVCLAVAAANAAASDSKASMLFIVAAILAHTVGELCIVPAGLSYVTRTAPVRFMSMLMGCWFLSNFVAHVAGGQLASTMDRIAGGEITLPWHFGGYADFFLLFAVTSLVGAVLALILSPLIKKLTDGRA